MALSLWAVPIEGWWLRLKANEVLNEIELSTLVHSGSHGAYDSKILQRLTDFNDLNPNATPSQCYDEVADIINDIRTAIANNPTTPINQLNF